MLKDGDFYGIYVAWEPNAMFPHTPQGRSTYMELARNMEAGRFSSGIQVSANNELGGLAAIFHQTSVARRAL